MRTYGELLRVGEFRALLLGLAALVAASVLEGLALATLVFDRTASPFLSAVALFGPSLAQAVGALLLLSAADRLPPRRVLTVLPLLLGAVALVVAVPGLPVGVLLAVVVASGVLGALGGAVRWGLLTEVLPESGWVLGRSTAQVAVGLVQVVGAAAGALALQVVSPRALLLVSAALFVLAAASARLGLRERAPRATGRASVRETLRVDRLLWATPGVAAVYLALWVPNGLVVGAEALFVPYAGDGAGLLFAAAAAGMLVGDLVAGRWLPARLRARLVTPLRLLLALPYLLFALDPGLPVAAVAAAVASVGFSASLLLQDRLVALAPVEARGQALGLDGAGRMTLQGVGALVAGGVAEVVDVGTAMAVMAAASLAASLALTPALRRSGRRVEDGAAAAAVTR